MGRRERKAPQQARRLMKEGKIAAKEEWEQTLKMVKYKALCVNDTIGLHDRQYVLMRKMLPSVKGASVGISAVKGPARR